jgi:hypothetical protein
MIDSIREIKPGRGLGELSFGQTREQVIALLGEPTEKEVYNLSDEDDEDKTESWHYDDYDLSLSFDEENSWKLSSIAVSSDDYLLEGQSLIGKSKEEVLKQCAENNWGTAEEDEEVTAETSGNSLVHIDKSSMSLWFEDDELTELQIGPFFNSTGISWPGEPSRNGLN